MVQAVSTSTGASGAPVIRRASRALALDARLTQRNAVRFVRLILLLISVAIGATVAWASVTEFPEIAATNGEVVPSGQLQAVQHLEGGIVAKLYVAEGDVVEKDALIARFDSANALAELDRMRARRGKIPTSPV